MNRILYRAAHTAAARKTMLTKIIRADHAGELGAVQIYVGQMAVLGRSSVGSVLQKMCDQERGHLGIMEKLSAQYNVPHSIFAPAFRIVSYLLGVTTALLGKKAAMACTIAMEELIAEHYNAQVKDMSGPTFRADENKQVKPDIANLEKRRSGETSPDQRLNELRSICKGGKAQLMDDDPEVHKELMKILSKLRDDELHHRDTGVKYDGLEAPMYDLLKFIIQAGCKGAIYVSERM